MISEALYLDYFNSLIDGNKPKCVNIVNELLNDGVEVKDIYTGLFQRSMYRVGQLWEKDRLTISTEHIATGITEFLLTLIYPRIMNSQKNGKTIVITCVDKEFHSLGARMVSDIFEMNGWQTIFLGANTPSSEILDVLDKKKPDLIGISNNLHINILRLLKLLDEINTKFPNQKTIIGGQAIAQCDTDLSAKFKNTYFISDLDSVENFLKKPD